MGLLLGFPVSDRTAESTLTCRKFFVKLDTSVIFSSVSSSYLLKDHDSVDLRFVHLMQKYNPQNDRRSKYKRGLCVYML